jgi:hypothetical protein
MRILIAALLMPAIAMSARADDAEDAAVNEWQTITGWALQLSFAP